MFDALIDSLIALCSGLPPGWRVFFLSMLPVTELRAAIPLGVLWELEVWQSFLWAVAGNFLPIIPLLLLWSWLLRQLSRISWLKRPLRRLEEHNQRKQEQVRRYGMPGLALLVAIPLPGTGIWTGTLAATLLSLPFAPALLAITVGEIVAGIAVSLVVGGALAMSAVHNGEWILAAILAAILIIFFIIRRKKKNRF